jgi:Ca2+-binding EF-hand superfamily protein
MSLSEKELVE